MVESNKPQKSSKVAISHGKIEDICKPAKNLALSDMDIGDISRTLCKMPDRNSEVVCKQTLALAFDIAASKMTNDDDKEVLANLRKMVGMMADDLL